VKKSKDGDARSRKSGEAAGSVAGGENRATDVLYNSASENQMAGVDGEDLGTARSEVQGDDIQIATGELQATNSLAAL